MRALLKYLAYMLYILPLFNRDHKTATKIRLILSNVSLWDITRFRIVVSVCLALFVVAIKS